MQKTYEQVHAGLFYERGPASLQTCPCGAQARHWAYQYNAGDEELTDSRKGSPYSENLWDHYAAMCYRCHRLFDWAHDPRFREPERMEALREHARRMGSDNKRRYVDNPEYAARLDSVMADARDKKDRLLKEDPEFAARFAANARTAQAVMVKKRKEDPEFAEHMSSWVRRRNRQCSDCGMVSNSTGMGIHLKHSGHSGWDEIEDVA